MVRLENTACTKEAKSIMTVPRLGERLAPPIFRGDRPRLRLVQAKDQPTWLGATGADDRAFAALMHKGVREEFRKRCEQ